MRRTPSPAPARGRERSKHTDWQTPGHFISAQDGPTPPARGRSEGGTRRRRSLLDGRPGDGLGLMASTSLTPPSYVAPPDETPLQSVDLTKSEGVWPRDPTEELPLRPMQTYSPPRGREEAEVDPEAPTDKGAPARDAVPENLASRSILDDPTPLPQRVDLPEEPAEDPAAPEAQPALNAPMPEAEHDDEPVAGGGMQSDPWTLALVSVIVIGLIAIGWLALLLMQSQSADERITEDASAEHAGESAGGGTTEPAPAHDAGTTEPESETEPENAVEPESESAIESEPEPESENAIETESATEPEPAVPASGTTTPSRVPPAASVRTQPPASVTPPPPKPAVEPEPAATAPPTPAVEPEPEPEPAATPAPTPEPEPEPEPANPWGALPG